MQAFIAIITPNTTTSRGPPAAGKCWKFSPDLHFHRFGVKFQPRFKNNSQNHSLKDLYTPKHNCNRKIPLKEKEPHL